MTFYPAAFSRPSYMNNHDMNRAVWAAAGDARRVRLAALTQFMLPSQPVAYHGAESGLSRAGDLLREGAEIARPPQDWQFLDQEMPRFSRELIETRKAHPAKGPRTRFIPHADARIAIFELSADGIAEEQLVVVIDTGETAMEHRAVGRRQRLARFLQIFNRHLRYG